MNSEENINDLLELISYLNYEQWKMLKIIVDIAFDEKVKKEKISLNEEIKKALCENLIKNGL